MSGSGKGKGSGHKPVVTIDDWTCQVEEHQVDGRCPWDESLIHLVYDSQGARALFRFSPETRQWYRQTTRGPKKRAPGAPPGVAAELDRKSQENAKLRAEVQRLKALAQGQSQPSGEAWVPDRRAYPTVRGTDFSHGQTSWIDSSSPGTYGSALRKDRAREDTKGRGRYWEEYPSRSSGSKNTS